MSIRKVVAGLLITAGIAIMAVPFFWRATGEKQTEQLISEFEQTLEDDYDEETDVEEEQTSISEEDEAILKEGGVIGIIEIPGLDIRYPVMEGTTSKVLNAGIGHIEETAGIGESGNCVLCGHNGSRYGTFFTPLNQISIGDEVMITDKSDWSVYVESLNLTLRQGIACVWDAEEGLFMPDFDVTIVYEGNIETQEWLYYEQDGMVVTLGNWLNGRLSCEQIEQLWCELIIPEQNKEQKESEE